MRCLAILDIVVYGAGWIALSEGSTMINSD
jgi:hypothetical protein